MSRNVMEGMELKYSSDPKLKIESLLSTRIPSGSRDIAKKRKCEQIFDNISISRTNSNGTYTVDL